MSAQELERLAEIDVRLADLRVRFDQVHGDWLMLQRERLHLQVAMRDLQEEKAALEQGQLLFANLG